MSRILLTGGSGFIGQHVIPKLLAMGFDVHAVGRRAPDHPGVTFHQADLLNHTEMDTAVRGVRATHLLHLAWNVGPGFWTSPANQDWTAASLVLLRAFTEAGGTRALFAGTCAEYSWTGKGRLNETTTELVPATLYGTAKDSLRRQASAYAQSNPVSIAWGRIFFLYGPGEKRGRLVRDAIDALHDGRVFATTAGHQKRDYIHVDDAAAALAALLASDVSGAVNIGTGTAVTVRSVLEELGREIGKPELFQFGALPTPASDPPLIEASVDRLRHEIGFTPRYSLAEGLAQTVQWYRDQAQ
jgi:nucleoside-diphosphate-sugar epimerase